MLWEDIARWRSGAIVSCAVITLPLAVALLGVAGYIVRQSLQNWSAEAFLVLVSCGGATVYGSWCMARDALRALAWIRRDRSMSYD